MSDDHEQEKFAFAEELQHAGKFCTTFARAVVATFAHRRLVPKPEDDTATVTFIEFEGKTYAVTAQHVIDGFRAQAEKDKADPEGYFLPKAPGMAIHPPFLQPPQAWEERSRPDIALRPIKPALPPHIGKRIYKLEQNDPEFPIPYALASGYPTALKRAVERNNGNVVELRGVSAVAKGLRSPDGDQVQFFSEVNATSVEGDISGMSGGPVFWSDGERHGLLGFVKEAMPVADEASESKRVHFICQRASYATFARWAAHADANFERERAALNERIKAKMADKG